MQGDEYVNLIVMIISWYICTLNLKLYPLNIYDVCQLYLNKAKNFLKEEILAIL